MKIWFIYTMECYAPGRNDHMQFIAMWMEMDDIMLNEVNQKKKDKPLSLFFGILNNRTKKIKGLNGVYLNHLWP